MKTYIYPENLKANVKLWFWSVRDFIIICCGIILSVVVLVNFWNVLPFCGDRLFCVSLASGRRNCNYGLSF